nr:MAG TPA: hypothetical protein [Caudoviricetes sp.]
MACGSGQFYLTLRLTSQIFLSIIKVQLKIIDYNLLTTPHTGGELLKKEHSLWN